MPTIADREWNDWRWQTRHRIRTLEQLDRMLVLAPDERQALIEGGAMLPVGITPYYMSLISRTDAQQPLRRTVVPTTAEFQRAPGEADDPLGRRRAQSRPWFGPSLPGSRPAAGARFLLDLLPLLHAIAGGRPRGNRTQREAVADVVRIHPENAPNPRCADFRR